MRFADFKGAQVIDKDVEDGYDLEVNAEMMDLDGDLYKGCHLALHSRAGNRFVGWVDFPDGEVYVAGEVAL